MNSILEWGSKPGIAMLVWTSVTLAFWQLGQRMHAMSGKNALVNPVLIAIVGVGTVLVMTRTPHEQYLQHVQTIHLLLGPAVVALAVPLYRQRQRLIQAGPGVVFSIIVGFLATTAAAIACVRYLGGHPSIALSIPPKSVTAPVALGIADLIGGSAPLAAVLAVATGTIGVVIGPSLLTLAGIKSAEARGLALGTGASDRGARDHRGIRRPRDGAHCAYGRRADAICISLVDIRRHAGTARRIFTSTRGSLTYWRVP